MRSFSKPNCRPIIILILFLLGLNAYGETCKSWLCGFNGLQGQSAFEEIAQFEQQEINKTLSEYKGLDPELHERLKLFRARAASTSYQETLKLCVAYRKFSGRVDSHQPFEFSDSVGAWIKILGEGLIQPVDGVVGLKGDFLEATEAGFFDFYSWFRSMYVLSFLNSSGFVYGAAHCLNSTDYQDIHTFASRILMADFAGTVGAELATGAVVGRLIGAGVKWWVLRPLASAFSKMDWLKVKPALVLSAGAFAELAADEFNCSHALEELNRLRAQKTPESILSLEHAERQKRIATTGAVGLAYNKFHAACAGQTKITQVQLPCINELKNLVRILRETRFLAEVEKYKADLSVKVKGSSELERTVNECGKSESVLPDVTKSDALDASYPKVLAALLRRIEKFNLPSN